jgi:hypothetical protein
MGVVYDTRCDRRALRAFMRVDDCTRECLAITFVAPWPAFRGRHGVSAR